MKISAIATDRSQMTIGARQFLSDLDSTLEQILSVRNDAIPAKLQNNRSDYTSFEHINEKMAEIESSVDPRSRSVKFDKKMPVSGTAERLATLERYAVNVASGDKIEYDVNEVEQYKSEVNYCCELVNMGLLGEDDFDIKE